MNKQLVVYILILTSIIPLEAKIGCMDNSLHLKEPYDTKAYHYVQCNCPCRVLTPKRNKCLYCKHAHDAQPFTLITPSKTPPASSVQTPIPTFQDAYTTLTTLIKNNLKNRFQTSSR